MDALRAVVARNLNDAAVAGLSADNRFGIAYDAALLSAKMVIARAGYRVKGPAAHHTTFQALRLAIGRGSKRVCDYLDRCRRDRNNLTYDAAGVVSDRDASDLLEEAKEFSKYVELWIAKHDPKLA